MDQGLERCRRALNLPLMKFLAPNIGRTGRMLRAVFGVACIVAGLALSGYSVWTRIALVAVGVFGLFEAGRGWCLARACGIKTRF